MVIDTSAIIAILLDEPERAHFNERIAAAEARVMSMMSYVEAAVVLLHRKQDAGLADLDTFLSDADIVPVAVDRRQAGWLSRRIASLARAATQRASTSAIASPTLSPRPPANRCCSRAIISAVPTLLLCRVEGRHPTSYNTNELDSPYVATPLRHSRGEAGTQVTIRLGSLSFFTREPPLRCDLDARLRVRFRGIG